MALKTIHSDRAPAAVGPYVQAKQAGNLLFISGQLPVSPETKELIIDDIQAAARASMQNIGFILEAAGADFSDLIKCNIYLVDMADFAAVNEVYAEFFSDEYPARACVAVHQLPKGARVEIEAVAQLN
ncbi:MAG: RidA family protein [Eubacteriales bacterium]|nr:RidA family protein [Eubacteriales bacterium]